ncbi:Myb-like_DNA-binding domain-containing protein [Hexamita inflata]|uniref:Myb-like DNA-binding domain-containing protein n=1 Tax=Hexamita inflata TaxID=28002 RepID=A0AA86RPM8_9EUKA|nr:Myb-like DNA-binding domain-containing protein [Hexamita inflata]
MKQYSKWSESENQRLNMVVKNCQTKHHTTNWKLVQTYFPDKTPLQLKSQFSNKQLANPKTYHSWTESDLYKLMINVLTHGENWSYIKTQFNFDVEESTLKSRWYKYKKEHQELKNVLKQIEVGQINQVQQVDKDVLISAQNYFHTVENRAAVYFGQQIQPTEYDLQMGQNKLNEVEIKPMEMFLNEFDLEEIKKNIKILENMMVY